MLVVVVAGALLYFFAQVTEGAPRWFSSVGPLASIAASVYCARMMWKQTDPALHRDGHIADTETPPIRKTENKK
jgi:hypothetical protein